VAGSGVVVPVGGGAGDDDVLPAPTIGVAEDAAVVVRGGVTAGRAVFDVLVRDVVGVTDQCHSVGGNGSAAGTGTDGLVARKINTEQTNALAVVAHTMIVLPRGRSPRRDHSVEGSIASGSIRHCAQAASPM